MLTFVTVAHADKPQLLRLPLELPVSAVPSVPELSLTTKRPAPVHRSPSYFEEHAARVQHDLLFFQHGYTLDEMRDRDRLQLYGQTPGTESAASTGAAIFAGAIMTSAHAPAPVRRLFDGQWHPGPAIFYGGGLGAGAGGHF